MSTRLYKPKNFAPALGQGYERASIISSIVPFNAPYEPSFITLEQFPKRHFWTFGMFAVLKEIDSDVLKELLEEGWEPWTEETRDLYLLLENQFGQTLIVQETELGFRYWARKEDLDFVRRYPVFLSYETAEEETYDGAPPQMVIGACGLIIHQSIYHRYTIDQLGEQGKHLYEQICAGMILFQLDDYPSASERHVREQQRLAAWEPTHEAAHQLAQLYWNLHHQQIQAQTSQLQTLPAIPYVIDKKALIVPSLPLEAIIASYSNAQSGANHWQTGKDLPLALRHYIHSEAPTFEYKQKDGSIWLQVRPSDSEIVIEPTLVESLWEQVRQMSDIDGDILLILIAQAIAAPHDEKGCVWITSKAILDYRGIKPIMKKERGRERRAGHRQEDMSGIATCIKRMADTWITVQQWIEEEETSTPLKKKRSKVTKEKKLYTHDSRLLLIFEQVRQHELQQAASDTISRKVTAHTPLPIAWRYQLGSWLDPFLQEANHQVVWLLQQVLSYDYYHQMWEKRLARYFTFHLRINASVGNAVTTRSVGQLVAELSLPINARDPEKTRQRFHRALSRLQEDGVISQWNYLTDNPELPPRKWLETWLTWKIQVIAVPLSTQHCLETVTSNSQE